MKTKKMVLIAAMCAISVVLSVVCRVPAFNFLTYDPKDVIIVIAGFILGPASALLISFLAALIEFFTIGDTGIIGFFMNLIASAAFTVPAAALYKKVHTFRGAVLSLLTGIFAMTVMMIFWNYIVTPFYMGMERAEVAKLLIPVFLPFNLIKGFVNSVITLIIYKPIVRTLRKSNII